MDKDRALLLRRQGVSSQDTDNVDDIDGKMAPKDILGELV
jgi:hypothetical protein